MPLATIEEALEDIRRGRFVIVVDDDDRENEGDMIMAAQFVTAEATNFLARHARGLTCVPMPAERLEKLGIPMMVQHNTSRMGTAFTVSVEARHGTTTGISAADRARTIRVLAEPTSTADDVVSPGHIFPLRAAAGGVLQRAGHTEAVIDLCRLAGLEAVGVLCEVMNDDGTMARLPDLELVAERHNLKIISIADLIEYRRRHETLIRRAAESRLPTKWGEFRAIAYENVLTHEQHVALVKGDVADGEPVLVRVHSECLTGDVFGSKRCDCGEQLDRAMAMVAEEGRGVILYMRQEGRGNGLHNKIRAYALQDEGLDTVEANERLGFPPDLRDYGIGAQILADMGVRQLRLLTNNPRKIVGLESHRLEVVEHLPIRIEPNPNNMHYLATKREKLGHLL